MVLTCRRGIFHRTLKAVQLMVSSWMSNGGLSRSEGVTTKEEGRSREQIEQTQTGVVRVPAPIYAVRSAASERSWVSENTQSGFIVLLPVVILKTERWKQRFVFGSCCHQKCRQEETRGGNVNTLEWKVLRVMKYQNKKAGTDGEEVMKDLLIQKKKEKINNWLRTSRNWKKKKRLEMIHKRLRCRFCSSSTGCCPSSDWRKQKPSWTQKTF